MGGIQGVALDVKVCGFGSQVARSPLGLLIPFPSSLSLVLELGGGGCGVYRGHVSPLHVA